MEKDVNPAAFADDNSRPIPGPKGVHVPSLRMKLDRLLQAHGRNQQWLADVMSTSSSAIAGWKNSERLPPQHFRTVCAMFELDRTLLLDSDPATFDAWLMQFQSIGSGRRWEALFNTCDHRAAGLRLSSLAGTAPSRLRGVRSDRLAPTTVRHAEISISDRPVFELDPSCLPATQRWQPANVILLLKDSERLQCLCPSADRGGFIAAEARWRFPGPMAKPLEFDDSIGSHHAVSIIFRDPLPEGIRDALINDGMLGDQLRLRPALDRLAMWLLGSGEEKAISVPHAIRSFRFVLLPRRPDDGARGTR